MQCMGMGKINSHFALYHLTKTKMRKQKSGHIVGISTVLVDQPLAVETITLQVHNASVSPRIGDGIPG